jgi:hypothetical protein
MTKFKMLGSAVLMAAALGVSSANAGGFNHGSSGLLGLNLNVGNIAGAKVSVGDTGGHHSGGDLLGLNVVVPGVANAKVDVGDNNRHGSDLINANVNVGGRNDSHCDFCGGYSGGVGGHDGW